MTINSLKLNPISTGSTNRIFLMVITKAYKIRLDLNDLQGSCFNRPN